MADATEYEQLAEQLAQGVMGSPKAPALMEILEILLPEKKAEIAIWMPIFQHQRGSAICSPTNF
jgi:hypothetical protein